MHIFAPKYRSWFLIFLGSLTWSVTMVKSGLLYPYGIGFWGANGHDGVWHISLINSLSRFTLDNPVFSGEILKNYHFGFDLLLAIFHTITRIPSSWLYFQILPPIMALAIGYWVYKFMFAWTKNPAAGLWGVFFIYFGGSFGWLVNLIRGAGWGGESMFWAQQSISTLINPPFALSLLIILYVLYHLVSLKLTTYNLQLITLSLIIGSLAFIKIYAVILFLPGLVIATIQQPKLLKLLVLSLLFSLLLYFPFNRGAGSLIVWQPFWFLENLMALSDRFFWPQLHQAMLVYKTTRNFTKFIPAYGLAFLIFIIGNLGTRLLAFLHFTNFKNLKLSDSISIILISVSLLGIFIPLFFVQRGTPWNTIQFFYYTQFVLGLFSAKFMSYLVSFKKLNYYLVIGIWLLVIILTVPTTFDSLRHYLPSRPPAMIGKEEVSALKFLSRQSPGVVFTPPVSPDAYAPAPRPLYLYESTAYVSAYSNQPVYLEDTVNLNITGYQWQDRLDQSKWFMANTDLIQSKEFLIQNRIRYLYLPQVAKIRPVFSASELGGQVIFENSQVAIWQTE